MQLHCLQDHYDITQLWQRYTEAATTYYRQCGEDGPDGGIRRFDVRLRLVMGMSITLDDQVAQVRSKNTMDTNLLYLEMTHTWFAYEAFLDFLKGCGYRGFKTNIEGKLQKHPRLLHLHNLRDACRTVLRKELLNRANRQVDLIEFVRYLADQIHLVKGRPSKHKQALEDFAKQLGQDLPRAPEHKHLLGFAYSLRNLFVHAGEAAKSGVDSYRTKIYSLRLLIDYLVVLQLQMGAVLLEEACD